jgi:hypothetical protein
MTWRRPVTHVNNVHWCCSFSTDVSVLTHRKGICRVLQHEADVSIMTQTGVRRFSYSHLFQMCSFPCVMSQTSCLDCYMSWRMPVCGLPNSTKVHTNTAFNAALCAVPRSTAPTSCFSFTTTRHVSVSQGPSSGVCCCTKIVTLLAQCSCVMHKINHCYCTQNLKVN